MRGGGDAVVMVGGLKDTHTHTVNGWKEKERGKIKLIVRVAPDQPQLQENRERHC